VKLAVLEPLAIDKEFGVKVTVPLDELDRVTVLLTSVVFGLPNESCRCTVIVPEATPAVTVTGEVVNTSLLAAAEFTVSTCAAEVIVLGEVLAAVMVGVPVWVSV
jgi:hypothetical protein